MLRNPAHPDKPCPCTQCKYAAVPHSTWRRHKSELETGTRLRHPKRPRPRPRGHSDASDEDGPESQSSGEDPAPVDLVPAPNSTRKARLFDGFCLDMIDLVARGQVNATGMENVMKVIDKHIRGQLNANAANELPTSWYNVQRVGEACVGPGSKHFYRHFCPVCGEIFPLDTAVRACVKPRCAGERYDAQRKPHVKALYYDIRAKMTRMLHDPVLGPLLLRPLPPAHRNAVGSRTLRDFYDGDIVNQLRLEYPDLDLIFVSQVRTRKCIRARSNDMNYKDVFFLDRFKVGFL
jgi:hypothetical protein